MTERSSGGCGIAVRYSTAACVEIESGYGQNASGTDWTLFSNGFTSCSPAGCRHSASDTTPCTIGAGAGTYYTDYSQAGAFLYDDRSGSGTFCANYGLLNQRVVWERI